MLLNPLVVVFIEFVVDHLVHFVVAGATYTFVKAQIALQLFGFPDVRTPLLTALLLPIYIGNFISRSINNRLFLHLAFHAINKRVLLLSPI